jgi:heparin/heparan-sulfate lyase
VAGDCTRAYSPKKLSCFTRQIVFIRPGTFIIFDRVCSTRPEFKKTWLLQAMKPPAQAGRQWVVTNGNGRLYVQTLLPEDPQVRLVTGADLYTYGGHSYPPSRNTGPAPECRIEISPGVPHAMDYFLHVLKATGSEDADGPNAAATFGGDQVCVTVGAATLTFNLSEVGGTFESAGHKADLAETVALPYAQP